MQGYFLNPTQESPVDRVELSKLCKPKRERGKYLLILFLGILLLIIGNYGTIWGGIIAKKGYQEWKENKKIPSKIPWGIVMVVFGTAFTISGGFFAKDGYEKWSSETRDTFKVDIKRICNHWNFIYLTEKKDIVPTSFAIFLTVTNRSSLSTRIDGYQINVYLESDLPTTSFDSPLGEWHQLKAVNPLESNVYWPSLEGLKKCRQLRLREVDFIELARKTQLKVGDSIDGWIYLEEDEDTIVKNPTSIEIVLKDSIGHVQSLRKGRFDKQKDSEIKLNSIRNPYWKAGELADLSAYKIRPNKRNAGK